MAEKRDHMTSDWPGFLAARLDELETAPVWNLLEQNGYSQFVEESLADIAAKRAILDDYRTAKATSQMSTLHPEGRRSATHKRDILDKVIQRLCHPFAGHPDWPGDLDD